MKRIVITGIILFINLILQSTLFHLFKIRGIMPNTAIIIIVSYSLLRGSVAGAVVGFFAGLLQDMFFGNTIGFYSLLGMLSGYFAGKVHQDFYRENYIMPLVLCALVTVFYETVVYISGFLFSGKLNYFFYFSRLILPEAVYTSVVSIAIYRILFSINEYLEENEKHRRKLFKIKF